MVEECLICNNITYLHSLPCKHAFCKSCICNNHYCLVCNSKYNQNKVFIQPRLLEELLKDQTNLSYYWLYSGCNNGWWHFDRENTILMEEYFQRSVEGKETATIAWQNYDLDFLKMTQTNRINKSCRKLIRIKSDDLAYQLLLIKGVAGVRRVEA